MDDVQRLEILRLLQTAKRHSAMNAIPHEHLMRAASSISEIAREMQDLAGGTDQMWQDVQRLFTTLVSLDGDATAIIIPIDDADMIKASAQLRLVRQIRLLGACRNAIPIVALKDGEIARHLIRETRNEYYPGAGFKADFDAGVEREVHDAVAQQLRKTFPQWATYRMPQPSWRESVHYRPRGDHRDFVDLLAAAEPRNADRSLVVSNMLLDPTGPQSTILDTGQVAHLLPTNLRKLAQLWSAIHLSTVERTGQRELDALARVLESLQNVVDPPFGIETPPVGKFEVFEEPGRDERVLASIDYRGVYGAVRAGDWFDLDTDREDPIDSANHVVYDFRPFAELVPRWRVSSSTVKDYLDTQGALSLLLAIQGVVTSDPQIRVTDNSRLTYGVTFDSIRFLQSIRIQNLATDDAFVSFPQSFCLISTVRVISSWTQIIDRARREHLALREILALSIHASVAIFVDDSDVDIEDLATGYTEAFAAASDHAHGIRLRRESGIRVTLRERHYLAWFQYWLPAHWHESIFALEDIDGFARRILSVSGGESAAEAPDHIYINRSLSTRLKTHCEEIGTTQSVEKQAWIGGYERIASALNFKMPHGWAELIIPAWRRTVSAPRVGGAAIAHSVAQAEQASSPLAQNRDFLEEGDADLLVAYVSARLRDWARP
ncbi:hypothetical protein [Microbacterium proteolyticum]|uniref:hypothetical protein n=2 Tax=Microbacterium proteolyticum TaxID=1572644 RepID=UPI002415AA84|nr:hypothetical protein [Microbacterium proteolyticum]